MPKGVYPRGRSAEERFEARVDRSGDCHLWTGALNSDGYANFWFEGRYIGAHVYAYQRAHGPLPGGQVVRHSHAGNRHCVRLEHLLSGTKGDNNRDRQRDGTQTRGSSHHSAVLTERDVVVAARLHRLGVSWANIGRRIGKKPMTIRDAVTHRKGSWKHVSTGY